VPDPVGDDDGPGGYQYPTAEEFKDGVYDMTGVTIYDEGDAWTFEVGIAGPVENTYLFETGFGVQVIELYIRDPDAGDEVPASTQGRPGSGLTFAEPWHYVAHVTGTGQVVEDASSDAGAFDDELGDPEVLASDEDGGISASASAEDSTISFTVAKDALGGGDIREKEAGLFVFSLDGFTPSEIRTNVGEEADLYRTGLGDNPARNSPKAFDMLDPEGTVSQSEALDYTEDEPATVPLFTIGESLVTSVGMIPDSVGDDDGPGGYQYPTAEEFTDDVYDITRVRVYEEDDVWTFEVGIAGPVENIYHFDGGFAVQTLQLYVHDPSAGEDVPTSTQGRPGSGLTFAEPWHYLVHVTGYDQVVEDASSDATAFDDELGDPEVLASREEGGISASASSEASTISFTVSKDALGGGDIEEKKVGLFVFSQDGFGIGDIRYAVGPEADAYQIGLGDNPVRNSPKAFDMLDPEGVLDQYDALDYTEDEPATVPLFTVGDALFDAAQGPVVGGGQPARDPDLDGLYEDIDGDGEQGLFDVLEYYNARDSPAVQDNPALFNFDGEGEPGTLFDALELYNDIF
jgi:carbohydrate-binding DOMON domain-containing protein